MRQIADLHIHSRYSRACSKNLTLENIDKTCRIKGVDIIATGDFTFPDWFGAIKECLTPCPLSPKPPSHTVRRGRPPLSKGRGDGELYYLKSAEDARVKFILSTELALIYKKNDPRHKGGASKARRIHIMVQAPNIKAVEELNKYLDKNFNIRSDGRPILGMGAEELVRLCLSIHPQFLIYPAHIWTPWFAVFGSKSGFDSMEECFGDYTKDIYAYETGLSSDPEMNWRLSALDNLTLLSNSDAHSLPNIAREANVFELENASYNEIYNVISLRESRTTKAAHTNKNKTGSYLDYTIEFYPEEGMYHYDGHRDCGVRFTPAETKKNKGICPKCKKSLVIGVMNRIDELADRELGFKPDGAPGFRKLVELDKIIAEAFDIKSRSSQKVQAEYKNIIRQAGTEMNVLLDEPLENLAKMTLPSVVEAVKRVREGNLIIEPGFDGQYGTVKIFSEAEKEKNNQQRLF